MEWYLKVLKQYAVFEGRARRKEYWVFILINICISIALSFLDGILDGSGIINILYSLAVLIPTITVSVRRLHDTDRSGWWLLLSFIPLIGSIILIVFLAQDSKESINKYGASPKLVET